MSLFSILPALCPFMWKASFIWAGNALSLTFSSKALKLTNAWMGMGMDEIVLKYTHGGVKYFGILLVLFQVNTFNQIANYIAIEVR